MQSEQAQVRIGVLTSGGDAPGMNAAVRAVVRAGLNAGAEVYAVTEGWQGAVSGGDGIREMTWRDVSGVLQRGGTVIGTARCDQFRTLDGRRTAVLNLLLGGIDRLVVIGGDGSLSGAAELREEWADHVGALVESGQLPPDTIERHPALMIAGVVGSIDNDMIGTDMTIGADSALHRITAAIDAVASTAASHQRAFIVRVMGRRCGYLALVSALAGGADFVFVPEYPPGEDWADHMCHLIRRNREAGRRDSIIIVAEGALDRAGNPITAEQVHAVLREQLNQDARITDLGHVQRGGTPSAYDRWMATLVGVAATEYLLHAGSDSEPVVIGMHRDTVATVDLAESVRLTRSVGRLLDEREFEQVAELRGKNFTGAWDTFSAIAEASPSWRPDGVAKRIAIMHAGALAPGMNTAAAAAVRLGIDRGHTMLGINGGVPGFAAGDVVPLTWGDVEGWSSAGGAGLGTRRVSDEPEGLPEIAATIERHEIDALLIIGGFDAYLVADLLRRRRTTIPELDIPVAVLPASIDNNLPGASMSIGADSALNVATEAVDRLKQSASANRRCVVAETMGYRCGFLAAATGLATGAERVYLHEEGISLHELADDSEQMRAAFGNGRRLFLAIRNEQADDRYTTQFLADLFEAESQTGFDARPHTIGHVQQGPDPTPFDRMTAIRFATVAIDWISDQLAADSSGVVFATDDVDGLSMTSFSRFAEMVDADNRRPAHQWWLAPMRHAIALVNEQPTPSAH